MDFAFMKKPVLYFQFDMDTYRVGHLPTGYFDYDRDGFGPIAADLTTLFAQFEQILQNGGKMDPQYEMRVDAFFTLRDANSSERTYVAIKEMINKP